MALVSMFVPAELEASITKGDKLTDLHINYAQYLLKLQFPDMGGLKSTLLQSKEGSIPTCGREAVQIVHCREDHWIVASNLGCTSSINIFDSAYTSIDDKTKGILLKMFDGVSAKMDLNMPVMQKQVGGKDCGLFSIAVATALAYGKDPSKLKLNQAKMRRHLSACFRDQKMKLFPTEPVNEHVIEL